MNTTGPLNKIIRTLTAATEHRLRFPGPMLEIPRRVLPGHLTLDRSRRGQTQRPIIPAIARALGERSIKVEMSGYRASCQGRSSQEGKSLLVEGLRGMYPTVLCSRESDGSDRQAVYLDRRPNNGVSSC